MDPPVLYRVREKSGINFSDIKLRELERFNHAAMS
jgi:hypothetical protein